MELLDSGNLVLFGENKKVIWQSFSHPTDTLLPGQSFVDGMSLKSFPNRMNLFHYFGYIEGKNSKVHYASLVSNSWNFYDKVGALVWKIVFSDHSDPKSFYAAILDPNGAISFYDLNKGKSTNPEVFKLPQDPCGIPEPCDPYYVCFFENWCECPTLLRSRFNCKPPNISACSPRSTSTELLYVGENLDYFALKYDAPVLKSTLNSCKDACVRNCSCLVLFHENSTGRCFHFDQTGSFQRFKGSSGGFVSYMKVSTDSGGIVRNNRGRNDMVIVSVIGILTVLAIFGLITGFWCYYKTKNKNFDKYPQDTLEEDDFFDGLSSMPARFTYSTLARATKDFSTKIGEGGFGSVAAATATYIVGFCAIVKGPPPNASERPGKYLHNGCFVIVTETTQVATETPLYMEATRATLIVGFYVIAMEASSSRCFKETVEKMFAATTPLQ
ncbi:hypothetical protein TSUD_113800 [Trifolium subterraneum]|uniref:Bulb-type lectin domain-containing protein n=1 Tax=Trifolium subterraneum TaxID=3900 RepID=A0A2Z6M6Z3_TRISU|nr:hypothetical protein TSUD_113800 [Trifolium subterraneum]